MTEHYPALGDSECHSVQYVFRAIQGSISLLLFSAHNNVDVGIVYRRRRVANAQQDAAHSRIGIADDANRAASDSFLKIRRDWHPV